MTGWAPCIKQVNSQSEPKRSGHRLSMLGVERARAHFRLAKMVDIFVSYESDTLTIPWPSSTGERWHWAQGQVFMFRR